MHVTGTMKMTQLLVTRKLKYMHLFFFYFSENKIFDLGYWKHRVMNIFFHRAFLFLYLKKIREEIKFCYAVNQIHCFSHLSSFFCLAASGILLHWLHLLICSGTASTTFHISSLYVDFANA